MQYKRTRACGAVGGSHRTLSTVAMTEPAELVVVRIQILVLVHRDALGAHAVVPHQVGRETRLTVGFELRATCTAYRTIDTPGGARDSAGRSLSIEQSAVDAADAIEVCRFAAEAVLVALESSRPIGILAYDEDFAPAFWVEIFELGRHAGQAICVRRPAAGQAGRVARKTQSLARYLRSGCLGTGKPPTRIRCS